MRLSITAFLMFMLSLTGRAQTSNYTFSREGGQISYLDPNDTSVRKHTVSDDVVLPAKVKIGFSFKFNGAFYDSVGISENGYIWFGPAQPHEMTTILNPIKSTLPPGVKGVVCAFGIDLHPHINTSLTTTIMSRTTMWAGQPNDFIVEWRNTSRADALGDAAKEDTIGFQVQLFAFEADRVQITYGYDIGLNPNITSSLSVGMKGADNTDFALRMTDGTHGWDNTAAGTSINSVCMFNKANNPGKVVHNYMSWLNNQSTGTGKIKNSAQIRLYPVPAADHLNLESDVKINAYQVFTPEGRLMMDETYTTPGIPVASLPAGLYFLKVYTQEGVYTKAFNRN